MRVTINVLSVHRKLAVESDDEWQAKASSGTQGIESVTTHAVDVDDARSMLKELTIYTLLD